MGTQSTWGVSNRPHFNMYKLLVSAALLSAVIADNPPAYAPAPAYHAAPAYKEEKLPPSLSPTSTESLKSPTREPQSTPQSPRRDTAMPPPTRLPLMPQPLLTSPLLNSLLD